MKPASTSRLSLWWSLYDFANSTALIVFYVFFPIWFVKIKGASDTTYNWAFVLSSLFFLLTAPYLGSRADRKKSYLPDLILSTIFTCGTYIATALITLSSSTPLWVSFALFTLSFYFYQITFIYYTPLLKYLRNKDIDADTSLKTSIHHTSGYGQAANYFGQVFGLLIAFPFVSGIVRIGAIDSVATPYLPATILFMLLTGIALYKLWPLHNTILKETDSHQQPHTFKEVFSNIKSLFVIPGMMLFFTTYFLLSDSVLTLSTNYSLYLTSLFNTTATAITIITIGILTSSAIGALVFGKISHIYGSYKALSLIIAGWICTLIIVLLANNFALSILGFLLAGFFLGPVWTISRIILIERTPEMQLGVASSIYTLAERLSTFIGPLIWAASLTAFEHLGTLKYKVGIFNLLLLVIVAGISWINYKRHLYAKASLASEQARVG